LDVNQTIRSDNKVNEGKKPDLTFHGLNEKDSGDEDDYQKHLTLEAKVSHPDLSASLGFVKVS